MTKRPRVTARARSTIYLAADDRNEGEAERMPALSRAMGGEDDAVDWR